VPCPPLPLLRVSSYASSWNVLALGVLLTGGVTPGRVVAQGDFSWMICCCLDDDWCPCSPQEERESNVKRAAEQEQKELLEGTRGVGEALDMEEDLDDDGVPAPASTPGQGMHSCNQLVPSLAR
jgi:hypothetical protein